MKKVFAFMLATMMVLSLFSGCSNNANNNFTSPGPNNSNATDPSDDSKGSWPNGKDINIICCYAAGGDVDTALRVLTPYLGQVLGCNVIVTNVNGGNGSIGMEEVMNSDNDGYTLLAINTASLSANTVTGLSEHTYKDMEVVGIWGRYSGETIYAKKDAPFSNLEEFVDYARENKVTMGVSMGGAVYAACVAMIADGLQLELIDAGDGPERVIQAANGSLDCAVASYANGNGYVENGDVKRLATFMADRIAADPDMPSVSEAIPSAVINTLFALLAPKGTDPEICQILNDAIMTCYEDYPEYVEVIEEYTLQSAEPMNIEDSIAELEVQRQNFLSYEEYLN